MRRFSLPTRHDQPRPFAARSWCGFGSRPAGGRRPRFDPMTSPVVTIRA